MTVSESERLALYEQLADNLGPGPAETLMDQLPPVKWDEMATKDDLRQLGNQLRSEMREGFTAIELRLTEKFAEQTRWMADRFAEQDRWMADRFAEQDRRITERFEEQDRRLAGQDRQITEEGRRFTDRLADQTRMIMLAIAGLGVTVWASLLGPSIFG